MPKKIMLLGIQVLYNEFLKSINKENTENDSLS